MATCCVNENSFFFIVSWQVFDHDIDAAQILVIPRLGRWMKIQAFVSRRICAGRDVIRVSCSFSWEKQLLLHGVSYYILLVGDTWLILDFIKKYD